MHDTAAAEQFRFLHPSVNADLMDQGIIPWWSVADVRITFFRPLSTLTHWLDFQLWPESHEMMHVHSLLWYGGLCVCLRFWMQWMGICF